MGEQTAKYYEQNSDAAASRWEQAQGAERYFRVAFPAGARVLDIGSGSGRDVAYLLRNGWDSYGIEPSSALRDLSVRLRPELSGRITSGSPPADGPRDQDFDAFLVRSSH
jgi:SAM-dependent methyltransferase